MPTVWRPVYGLCVAKTRADKLWVECAVGMSKANDLGTRNPEGPLGPEAYTDLLGAVGAYSITPIIFLLFY
jgi:hypothetical protein